MARKERKRYVASTSASVSAATDRKSGVLHVVATPIGNLGDLSARAREVLGSVAVVLAEDTRHTAQLLAACGVATPMVSAHEHNEAQRVPAVLERLSAGEDVALVSDAGTPLVSDPGLRLVSAVAAAGFEVRAVPGPCAAIAALSIAGLPSDRFRFEGFLPAKAGARRERLEALARASETLLFYESPHRLQESLADLEKVLGGTRRAVIARELTKLYETAYRGTLAELAARAGADADLQRGEIVLVVEGAEPAEPDRAELRRVLEILLQQLPVRQAAELAAQLTQSAPNAAYKLALNLRGEG